MVKNHGIKTDDEKTLKIFCASNLEFSSETLIIKEKATSEKLPDHIRGD